MYHFIDESGSFSWRTPGISLFASLLVTDRSLPALLDRFVRWKRNIIGKSKRELKGNELTDKQMESFAYKVFPLSYRDAYLTLVGADTRMTSKSIVERHRDQLGEQAAYCSRQVAENNPTMERLVEEYRQMAGWLRHRSAENVLWANALEHTISLSTQHSILRFLEPADDAEFENTEIVIDRSFIKEEAHIAFWRVWLRNGLRRRPGVMTPDTWHKRDHPFIRKYFEDGILHLGDPYHNHMRFDDSKQTLGLQVVDICANICGRVHRGQQLKAYSVLMPRMIGKHSSKVTLVHLNEGTLYRDGVENHVGALDIEDMKRQAEEWKSRELAASKAASPVESV